MQRFRPKWMILGVAIGTAIGVATDAPGTWLTLGIAIGVVIDAAEQRRKR